MKKFLVITVSVIILILLAFAAFSRDKKDAEIKQEEIKQTNQIAVLKTNKGDVEIELFSDKMSITTGNFVKLAQENFYDNVKFHRVIKDFVIQAGDPNSKGDNVSVYGVGGPGYMIKDEFVSGLSNLRGTISMANTGAPNSGGSQFFINLKDNIGLDFDKQPLTSKHSVFGKVVSGMEIVDVIASVPVNAKDLPLEAVIIKDIIIK